MIDIMRGHRPADDLVREVWKPDVPVFDEKVSENLLRNSIVECFADSMEGLNKPSKTGVPLGALAESLVISLTTLDPMVVPEAVALIHIIPQLSVYGQIEEM